MTHELFWASNTRVVDFLLPEGKMEAMGVFPSMFWKPTIHIIDCATQLCQMKLNCLEEVRIFRTTIHWWNFFMDFFKLLFKHTFWAVEVNILAYRLSTCQRHQNCFVITSKMYRVANFPLHIPFRLQMNWECIFLQENETFLGNLYPRFYSYTQQTHLTWIVNHSFFRWKSTLQIGGCFCRSYFVVSIRVFSPKSFSFCPNRSGND